MSIPAQYEQFVGSPYPRVYASINGGANPTFDEYDEDPQPHNGPFVLKSAYDALYEILRSRVSSGVQTALEDGTPFTFIGTEPSLREKIDAACKEAAEHGENFGFFGNTITGTSVRVQKPRPDRPYERAGESYPENGYGCSFTPPLVDLSSYPSSLQPPAVPPYAYPQTHYERKVSESTSFYQEPKPKVTYQSPLDQAPEDTIRRMFGDTPGADL